MVIRGTLGYPLIRFHLFFLGGLKLATPATNIFDHKALDFYFGCLRLECP
jgi:hypothetical protein